MESLARRRRNALGGFCWSCSEPPESAAAGLWGRESLASHGFHLLGPLPPMTPVPLMLRPSSASYSLRPELPRLLSVLQQTDKRITVASGLDAPLCG